MERDIKSIILLLATQAMINLGVIEDPILKQIKLDIEGAEVFIQMIEVIDHKTQGNLTDEEIAYLHEVLDNLKKIAGQKNVG